MADSRDPLVAALEAQHANDLATIAKWRAMYDDECRMTRGFRRLFVEALRKCRDCPTCNPPTDRSRC